MSERTIRMLFICTGNSARSQMAEGLARAMGKGRIESYSAGTDPKPVHPLAVKVMADIGIDISRQTSKGMDQFLHQEFDYVISVCERATQTCPVWPKSKEQIRWSFDDPSQAEGSEEERLRVFRRVRNEIQQRINLALLAAKVHVEPAATRIAR